ncbi:hypothetical protein JAAARDRAFT_133886 [Jaapia argillacea MUCL 33604]|uniref:LysM domain-containing protein n=1 Tax=Jaapia argillacea MUCL 33604 TaxID=933084 RepID=A0A067PKP6_9AGAM|nr:hypothetical protein JAAARDRAFT_133886 [Jaapia argillacea MUCL 33604]
MNVVVAADCTRTYVVKTGEICDGISAAQHVSTYQLAALNPGINADCSNLVAGWNLCLGLATEDCTTTYVVQLGDTCETIESQQGVNATMLYLNNPQISSDCSNLYVGEVGFLGVYILFVNK